MATKLRSTPEAAPSGPADDAAPLASELRIVLGRLIRRLRAEHRFPLSHGVVLGRLDREGPLSVSDLAAAERVRQQSMAQTVADLEGDDYVERRPDPGDRRRALVSLTAAGRRELEEDRSRREGWLAEAIAELAEQDRRTLERATALLDGLADA